MTSGAPGGRRDLRWRGALEVFSAVWREPGVIRAALARHRGLSTGSAAEILARLRALSLVCEGPAPVAGRGRPTTVLGAHPGGPLVLAADLRHEDWRLAVVALDGRLELVASGRHLRRDPRAVLGRMARAVAEAHARWPGRVRALSVAVPGAVQGDRLAQAAGMGWGAVDLRLLRGGGPFPLLAGNDATLAGVAEARAGAARDAHAVLHLTVEVGLGGILVVGGIPAGGATGAGGEFGHLPMGDPRLLCPCGARGCWDMSVDGRAMARHLGEPAPANARTYAREVLARSARDPAARRAVRTTAKALGAGTAGLVNALDPEVVTLGGLAVPLLKEAPRAFLGAYSSGLMAFRRAHPPQVRPAAFGDDGALRGAAEVGLDAVLTETGLEAWASERTSR
jgi:predicted NBD/HSP70 family sugar kinase